MTPKLSLIIVSYNVREFLLQALSSMEQALQDIPNEIWIVDNASSDGTVAVVKKRFPGVQIIANNVNIGFAKANNQALALAKGDFLCLINPDTLVQENTFSALLKFLKAHPSVGLVGCKILNPDGTLQLACRRSIPTPWVAFSKIVGLAKLFPHSKLFGKYNLTFLDPDETYSVEAISGSFMLFRRQVYQEIGGLDESFFMYGEDLDYCHRIRQAGWTIYYHPATQIIHFKGESSKKSPYAQRRLFYEAMRLFVLKHFPKGKALLPSWFLLLAIRVQALFAGIVAFIKQLTWPALDFFLMTFSIAFAIWFRFNPKFPLKPFLLVHVVYSIVWFASLAGHGLYTRWRLSGSKAFSAILTGWILNSTLTYFFKQYAFSRAVVLIAGGLNLLLIPGVRGLIKFFAQSSIAPFHRLLREEILLRRSLVVGDAESVANIIKKLSDRSPQIYQIQGVVLDTLSAKNLPLVENVPVVGGIEELPVILPRLRPQVIIFSTDRIPYHQILSTIALTRNASIQFKLVPSNLDVMIGKATTEYLSEVPLVDLEYRLHSVFYRGLKRATDIVLSAIGSLISAPIILWQLLVRKRRLIANQIWDSQRYIVVRQFELFDGEKVWWHRLPWIWTVLLGDMSMVGRELCEEQIRAESESGLYLKPGLTGLEQLSQSTELSNEEREKLRIYYLKNYSPLLDIEIIMRTVFKK